MVCMYIHFIIYVKLNNEVHFHIFSCAMLLLPLASYFIALTNVNLVYSKIPIILLQIV